MADIKPATQTIIITEGYNASPNYNQPPIIISGNTRWRNKPQSNAASGGSLIFLSAGMNMAIGLGWSQYSLFGGTLHYCYSWFIGVIIGTILAMPLLMFTSKKYILAASTLLILVGGIIFTSVPFNYDALLAARYINGIAVGLATVTYLLHASEVAVDSNRGYIVSLEQYYVSVGIAVQMIYTSYWSSYDFPINRLHGIFDIIFGAIAAVMLIFFIESPIDQIRMGDEDGALATLARLQRPGGVTIETTAWLEQCKMYVREHESMSITTSVGHAFLPLQKMLLFRSVMLAFSYSLPLTFVIQLGVLVNASTWMPTVAGCCRIFGGIITIILIDRQRRKLPSLIWIACIGGLLIALGTIFQDILSASSSSSMYTSSALYIIVQLFAGLFTPYTSVLLAEAFPLRVKGVMMGICIIAEQLIQIIVINTIKMQLGDCLMAQGIIVVVGFLMMIVCIAETRGTSLSEAQRRFRNPFYMKFK